MSVQPLPLRFRISLRRNAGTLGSAWTQPLAIAGMVLAGAWILVAVFVPLIAPYDPLAQTSQLFLSPSAAHWFGTDELGRDILSRVLWGSRLSLPLAFLLVAAAVAVGGAIGGVAGYFGGWIDEVVAPAELMDRAVSRAQTLAALPATTFAMTKRQMHLPVVERLELVGDEIDGAVTDIWAAPDATARIQDYVARTLKKR